MELMNEMMAEIDRVSSDTVMIWINWMMIIFLASIFFVWKHWGARLAFAAFWGNLALALYIFHLTKNAHLIGISHIVLWGPLAIFILAHDMRKETFTLKSFYGVWSVLLVATIAISLYFDIRDTALISLGMKQ